MAPPLRLRRLCVPKIRFGVDAGNGQRKTATWLPTYFRSPSAMSSMLPMVETSSVFLALKPWISDWATTCPIEHQIGIAARVELLRQLLRRRVIAIEFIEAHVVWPHKVFGTHPSAWRNAV